MSIYLRNFFRFILLVLIQVLILNQIHLYWWATPAVIPSYLPLIYPLFILFLPISTPVPVTLLLSFVLGITIDAFSNTGGVHAAACVAMGYGRLKVLSLLLPKKITEYPQLVPNIKSLGWNRFLTYTALLLALHHLIFFSIEMWGGGAHLGYFLMKLLLSYVTSIIFVVVYSMIFAKSVNTSYIENY
jgi:hypothetical protein